MRHDAILILRALALIALAAPLAAGCDDEPGDGDADADVDGDADSDSDADGEDVILPVTILATSDVHHRASGFGPQGDYTPLDATDSDPVLGGYARLATLIDQIRTEQEAAGVPVLVVDSGDFMMGAIYDMTAEDPLAFAFLQAVGYDAVTLGNHEFDWGPAGLSMLLDNALAATPAFAVPIVASNTILSDTDPADDALAAHRDAGVIQDTLVLELSNGLRVGIFGLMGTTAEEDAPTAAPVTFDQSATYVAGVLEGLRTTQGAQMVLALSHQGLDEGLETGEDINLARGLDGIDVIASGHSHLPTRDLIDIDGTLIMQPGEYGEWLARLDLQYNVTQGRVESSAFELIPVDDTIEGDADVQALVDAAHAAIDPALEAAFGVGALDPIAELGFPLVQGSMVETALGDLCADAVRASSSAAVAGSADPTPFTVGVVPNGVLRDNLHAGAGGLVTFSDAYNLLSLGMSPDPENQDAPGWPLISAYLTARELVTVCEVPASVAGLQGSNSIYLNLSGIRCDYDPDGVPLHTVTAVSACTDAASTACDTELDLADETTLYRLVTDLYTFSLMSMVTVLLPLEPKHADGTPFDLADPTDYMPERIDVDPATAGVQELANWAAVVQYLMSLPSTGGDPALPDVPEDVYGETGTALGRLFPTP